MSNIGSGWGDNASTKANNGMVKRTVRTAIIMVAASLLAVSFIGKGSNLWSRIGQTAREAPAGAASYGSTAADLDLEEGRELAIRVGPGGHYWVTAFIDGVKIRFVVDTGASSVALRPDDARRLGLHPATLHFSERYNTANGIVRGAPVTLGTVRIGQLTRHDVSATVHESPMGVSLLGMSFLNRLESYEVANNRMILRW